MSLGTSVSQMARRDCVSARSGYDTSRDERFIAHISLTRKIITLVITLIIAITQRMQVIIIVIILVDKNQLIKSCITLTIAIIIPQCKLSIIVIT